MNKSISRSGLGVAITLLLGLTAGPARALDVLTFDTKNAGRHEVSGGLGFSITQVGSHAVPGLDLSLFDVIYVNQSYEEFLKGSLLASLGLRAVDLQDFVSHGGGMVFGSHAPGLNKKLDGKGAKHVGLPHNPIVKDVDLSGLGPDVSAVPEPGTFALFGLGVAGLFFVRRRMKAKA
jgi:hypothetical protein